MPGNAPLLHIALVEPAIPNNTGNAGRLALSWGLRLHLVGKLGFSTDEKACRRAGLDYWKHVDLARWDDLDAFEAAHPTGNIWAFSARAERRYDEASFAAGDVLVFGNEQRGLSRETLARPRLRPVRIPIATPKVRSLNLANAISIGVFEALRQLGFPGDHGLDAERAGASSSEPSPRHRVRATGGRRVGEAPPGPAEAILCKRS